MPNPALSLDLGTTSISAAAVDQDGRLVAHVQVPNTAAVTGLPSGHAEQDPRQLLALALSALRQLAEQLPGMPYCLALTGQMHGGLLVDAHRRPLTNLITWQDRRANDLIQGATHYWLDQLLARCDDAALQRTGCRLAPGYLGVTLFILSQQGAIPAQTAKAAFIADWIATELCDREIMTDRSNAAASGVYDLVEDRWSGELIRAAEIPSDLLPLVRESGAVIGDLTPEMAAETGLPSGLPICNAIGDDQAAVLGSVPAGDPAIQVNIGTGGQINWPIERFLRVDGMDTRYLPQGRFMLVGAGLAGGDAYAWVNRTARSWLSALGHEASSERVYAVMSRLAEELPDDNDGLTCEPLFRGTRRQPTLRGSFHGVSPDNFTLGHVARAVLQGIARGMYSFYENAGEAKPTHLPRLIGSGNGLRENPLLRRLLAQTFGRELWLPTHREEAAYGAALLGGVMTGLWPSLEAAGRCIQLEPDAGASGGDKEWGR